MSRNPSILCVDDDAAVLQTTELILQRAGYNVFSVIDAAEASRLLHARQFDLVLLDCVPGCRQLIDEIRRSHPQARIAVMTGDPDAADLPAVDDVLPKPLAPPHS